VLTPSKHLIIENAFARWSLWGVFFAGLALVLYLFAPFFKAIFLGAVFASLLLPVHRFLMERWRFNPTLSSFLLTLLTVLTLALLLSLFISILVPQILSVFHNLQAFFSSPDPMDKLLKRLDPWLKPLGIESNRIVDVLMNRFYSVIFAVIQNVTYGFQKMILIVTGILGDFFVMLLSLYLFLRYSSDVKQFFNHVSPLPPDLRKEWGFQFHSLVRAFFVGGFGTALIQGGIAVVGYWIAGLSSIPALFLLTATASFIPFVGTSLVWGPIVIYLLLTGEVGKGIFLLIYCVGVVSTIDQWVKPLFVGSFLKLPTMIVFLAILTGIKVFGFLGILAGPLIFSLFLSLTRVLMERTHPLFSAPFESTKGEQNP
jgi:predicted PurR-regulated permease PerM